MIMKEEVIVMYIVFLHISWTISPGHTLIFILISYLQLLYLIGKTNNHTVTLEATGHQW